MCLIAFAWRAHARFDLALVANRDEFHDRPAAAAAWWTDAPQVYGGRDLSAGGGWLAVSRGARLAAVTNVRRMIPPDPQAPSRGALVADFARGSISAREFCAQLAARAGNYSGFNLLVADGAEIYYATNAAAEFHAQALAPGVHALSNAALDTPWPKLVRVRDGLARWCADAREDQAPLFELLADERTAPDAELPDTGVGRELERFLSPPFIRGERYGTRACSVVTLEKNGAMEFAERRFGGNGMLLSDAKEAFQTAKTA